MKIVDVHTHVFPDAIADKTIASLSERAGSRAYANGKIEGLLESMDRAGVACSVLAPVVTAPKQFESINRFASNINKKYASDLCDGVPKLISLGGIHPDSEDYKTQLKYIKSMGFKGIKLHPDYQGVFFDDIKYKRIVSYATELDMMILVHAGVDIGLPEPVHCTPRMALEILKETECEKLVLAHFGGFKLWNEVEEYLVGRNIYMDTAFIASYIDEEQFLRIVRNHGADKILFGSDSPWAGQKESVDWVNNLLLTVEEKENILWKNVNNMLM